MTELQRPFRADVLPVRAASPKSPRSASHAPGALHFAGLAALAALAGCAGSDDEESDNPFVVRSTRHAAANAATPLLGDGDWLAYLLSEGGQGSGGGTDFNNDGDRDDAIATRVNTSNGAREILDVAALSLAFARRTLFMVVDESQGPVDWSGDGFMDDRVLLYIAPTELTPTYLDTLASGPADIAVIGGSVIYASATAPMGARETNVRIATVDTAGAAPGTPVTVLINSMDPDPGADGVSYRLSGNDSDVVFLLADETVEGADLNGDLDSADTAIFAVLDAGATVPEVASTELAGVPGSRATAVPVAGGGEWLIAFLVSEADQGANLNDPGLFSPTWLTGSCGMGGDGDMDDAILHWFQLTDLAMNTPAVNTGLVGAANGTAFALRSEFVGVVSPETITPGVSGTDCDLNGDADTDDFIFRWVNASNPAAPVLPVTTQGLMLSVDTSVPGGSGGVVRLSDLWVLNVDEAASNGNFDGDATTDRELIGALRPSSSTLNWNFDHGTTTRRPVGVTWMSEDPESSSRFFAAFSEEVNGIGGLGDINGDGDELDAVPTVPTLVSGNILTFPGVQNSTNRIAPGLTVEENVGYHRISEAQEGNTDLNGDGDSTDVILQRFSLLNPSAFPRTLMATSGSGTSEAVSFGVGDARFGAFVTEEFQANGDLNGDGDTGDFVVRYFRLP